MDLLRSIQGVNVDQNIDSATELSHNNYEIGTPKDGQKYNEQAAIIHNPFHYDKTPLGHGLRQLAEMPDMIMGSLDAAAIGDWESEMNASLQPEWTLGLEEHMIGPDVTDLGSRAQTFTDEAILGSGFAISSQDPSLMSSTIQQYEAAPFSLGMGLSSATDEVIGSTCSSEIPTVYTTNSPKPALPIPRPTRKRSKRQKLSSLVARKRQKITSREKFETDQTGSQEVISIAHTSTCRGTPPVSDPPENPNIGDSLPPSHNCPRCEHQSDCILNWKQLAATDKTLDGAGAGAGATENINIAPGEQRPLSWPRRKHIRRSLEISVAALTKGFAKKARIDDENNVCA